MNLETEENQKQWILEYNNNFMEQKTDINELKEKYPSFFEAFPFRLIDFVLSGEMAQKIANICIENRVLEQDKIEKIAYKITFVVFNKIQKETLASVIEEDAGIPKETAEKITISVDKIILSQIHKLKESEEEKTEEKEEQKTTEPPPPPPSPDKKDTYRESIS